MQRFSNPTVRRTPVAVLAGPILLLAALPSGLNLRAAERQTTVAADASTAVRPDLVRNVSLSLRPSVASIISVREINPLESPGFRRKLEEMLRGSAHHNSLFLPP